MTAARSCSTRCATVAAAAIPSAPAPGSAPDGAVQPLGSADVAIEVEDHWRSAAGDRYPARWRLRVARLALDLTLLPVLPDQELHDDAALLGGCGGCQRAAIRPAARRARLRRAGRLRALSARCALRRGR